METDNSPEYFATCQLPSQGYESKLTTSVISIEAVTATHPYHNDVKKLPKTHPFTYWSVQCQATPAFPLGGGQAGDYGTMIAFDTEKNKQFYKIVGTFRINNLIYHVISTPKERPLDKSLKVDDEVTIIIDMQRRLFNMHNHTTQHLLSAIFSQLFKFDTFGWTSGLYLPTPVQTLPFNPLSWKKIQETLSTIDFTGDFISTMESFSFNSIVKFMVNTASNSTSSYPFSLFMTKIFDIFSIFLTQLSQQDEYHRLVLECTSFDDILAINLDTLLSTYESPIETLFQFDHLALAVEIVANFAMTTDQRISIDIQGLIEEPIAPPEQSTSSMGSTTSSTDADGTVIRQNVTKYSKYAKSGAVPKRFVSIGGIEKSPCCGTHADLNHLQSVSILTAFKHGGGKWRIAFTPAISSIPATHWSYQLADQLKSKFACQFDEIDNCVEKNIQIVNSLKHYKTKIYNLIGKMLFDEYQRLLSIEITNKNIDPKDVKIVIHYNDPFLSTTDDLNSCCYAMSEACNTVGITSRPILIMTNHDTTVTAANPLVPGIFLLYGSTETQAAVKHFGNIFVTTLACKGGGRPGVYQGKIPSWENFDETKKQLAENDQGWVYSAPVSTPNSTSK